MVPERSVLGSLLLNIFSNCLGNGIENLLIKSAEDTTKSYIFENRTRMQKDSGNQSNGLKNMGQCSKTTAKFSLQK